MDNKHMQHPTLTEDALSLGDYAPISLEEIQAVALQNRIDTKYVLPIEKVQRIMPQLTEAYSVMVINDSRLNDYRTLYFDTADFEFFRQHHAGKLDRYKVRSREYLDSHMTFLEVKHKTNKGRTVKRRVRTPALVQSLPGDSAEFLHESFPFDANQLDAKLRVDYSRITLASKTESERVTIDINLTYKWLGQTFSLPHIAIVELKQEHFSRNAAIAQLLRKHQIRPTGFSKYCVGVSLLYPNIKHNNFKGKLRLAGI